jgi:hypothetical protein
MIKLNYILPILIILTPLNSLSADRKPQSFSDFYDRKLALEKAEREARYRREDRWLELGAATIGLGFAILVNLLNKQNKG